MAIPGVSSASEMGAMAPTSSASAAPEIEDIEIVSDEDKEKAEKAKAAVAEKKKQAAAKGNFANDIKNGHVSYNDNPISDDIDISTGNMTLREIEKRYNLAPGTLAYEKTEMNGYYATQKPAGKMVNIKASTLSKGLGIKKDELQKMVPKDMQVSFGENLKRGVKEAWNRIKSNF